MKTSAGVTLIELVVVIVILGVSFSAMVFSQVLGFKITRESQKASVVKDITTEKIEEIRAYGYFIYKDCVGSSSGSPAIASAPPCSGTETSSYAGYQTSWTVTKEPVHPMDTSTTLTGFTAPPLISIEVTATGDNGSESYTLMSYLSCADAGEFSFTDSPCPQNSMKHISLN